MHHDVGLVTTIAMGFVLAFAFGFLASRLRLPPLVGYLVAGISVGPFTPGFQADANLASQLAEVGVILLMFGVGLHFSVEDLRAVRGIALPGAATGITVMTVLGIALSQSWGWSFGGSLVFGLCLSVASTVVLLRALDERNAIASTNGRIAVGWLIVEDLVMVFALVLVPALAGALGGGAPGAAAQPLSGSEIATTTAFTIVKVVSFVVLMLLVGPRVLPPLLRQVARAGSRELFTLAVLASALGIALLSASLFGVSFALGAFCAGMVLSKSEFSHKAANESLPLQDAFAVLFFVSVGMLFDPTIVVREPGAVLLTTLVIIGGKSLVAFGIVLSLGYPLRTALGVGASLGQIGEFSFILAGLGMSLSLLPSQGQNLILAGAIASIIANPLLFAAVKPLGAFFERRGFLAPSVARRAGQLGSLEAELEATRLAAEAAIAARTASLQSEEVADKFPIFGRLAPEDRSELAGLFTPRGAAPGERVIRRGEPATEIFFISSGEAEVAVGGRSITLGPGDFFGEMGVLSGNPRSADVTAIDYCELLVLSRADILAFLGKHPELSAAIGGIADRRAEMNRDEVAAASAVAGGG